MIIGLSLPTASINTAGTEADMCSFPPKVCLFLAPCIFSLYLDSVLSSKLETFGVGTLDLIWVVTGTNSKMEPSSIFVGWEIGFSESWKYTRGWVIFADSQVLALSPGESSCSGADYEELLCVNVGWTLAVTDFWFSYSQKFRDEVLFGGYIQSGSLPKLGDYKSHWVDEGGFYSLLGIRERGRTSG